MAPGSALLCTGFLPALDWRPLYLERPLPHGRVCQVCGIVSKETVQLPCFHTLCNVCYEGSVNLGCVCPLDREAFSQEGIDKLRLRPEQVLKLRLICWNSAHGCNFVGPASELLDHFAKECVYHKVPCPKCHQNVTRLRLVQHQVKDCDSSAEPSQPNVTYRGQLRQELEKIGAVVTQSMAELNDGYDRLQNSFNRVAVDVKMGLSEVKQAIEGASGLSEYLKSSGVDIKQSIARPNSSGQQASANTGGGDDVRPARFQDRSSAKREVIRRTNMSTDMQRDAMDAATQALDMSNVEEEIAQYISKAFSKKYKPSWQCIVGESFSSCVYAKENHFIHFKLGRFSILLFK